MLDFIFPTTLEESAKNRWFQQGFKFSDDVSYGLIQSHGGPCGILAAVNAYILKNILDESLEIDGCALTEAQQHQYLAKAINDCLWQCASGITYIFDLVDSSQLLTLSSTLSEDEIVKRVFMDKESSLAHIIANINQFQSDSGVLLFVLSLLESRGLENVKDDMDDPETLVLEPHGHCSQDLLNLLICGHAVTHTFDGKKKMGESGLMLKGIPCKPLVGFLSEMEVMRYLEIGSFLKNPEYPIWIIGSSTHYSLLFSSDLSILKKSELEELKENCQRLFKKYDEHEGGFISRVDAEKALTNLIELSSFQISRGAFLLERAGNGVVLWSHFFELVKHVRETDKLPPKIGDYQVHNPPTTVSHVAPSTVPVDSLRLPWNCGTCTMSNNPVSKTCCVCGANRPIPTASLPPVPSTTSTTTSGTAVDLHEIDFLSGLGISGPPPKQKFQAVPAKVKWNCASCTLLNEADAVTCSLCGTAKPPQTAPPATHSTTSTTVSNTGTHSPSSWVCEACTMSNPSTAMNCTICNTVRPPSEPEVILKKRRIDDTSAASKSFPLFYYNGFAHPPENKVTLVKMIIQPLFDETIGDCGAASSFVPPLQAIIHTRWPAAEISSEVGRIMID
eukprot:TRINITY_DN53758_c0_g1_i1.p1 TRINITY_DN53758_c0_g1~~TRINITY_DN53758_c0_g1_i1.p1  ORF type:complete len:618 (-),score=153.00 TRINITY_DN53758_c0_g1_i1:49-1902(-)